MNIDWNCEEARGCDWAVVKVDILEDFSTDLSFSYFKEKPQIINSKFWALHKRPEVKQMNIDWDCEKAKGKDYCLYYNESNYIFCKQKPTNNGECWLVERTPAVRYFTLHERPKAEQMKETIYTKEMHERGEVVGSEMTAMYKDKEVIIRLGCDTFRNVVFRLDGEWVTVNVDDIKPIDTRTDREKAIDDLSIVIENYNKNPAEIKQSINLAKWLFNDVSGNQIHGITFTGDK